MEFGEFGSRGDDVWDDSTTGGGAAHKQTNKRRNVSLISDEHRVLFLRFIISFLPQTRCHVSTRLISKAPRSLRSVSSRPAW